MSGRLGPRFSCLNRFDVSAPEPIDGDEVRAGPHHPGPLTGGDGSLWFRMPEYSAYFNDSWSVTPRLKLNLGVRWDKNDGSDQSGNKVVKDSKFSPRLGLTYNWDKIGVFKLHFGRYYEYVGTGDYFEESRFMATVQYRMATADIGKGPEAMTIFSGRRSRAT